MEESRTLVSESSESFVDREEAEMPMVPTADSQKEDEEASSREAVLETIPTPVERAREESVHFAAGEMETSVQSKAAEHPERASETLEEPSEGDSLGAVESGLETDLREEMTEPAMHRGPLDEIQQEEGVSQLPLGASPAASVGGERSSELTWEKVIDVALPPEALRVSSRFFSGEGSVEEAERDANHLLRRQPLSAEGEQSEPRWDKESLRSVGNAQGPAWSGLSGASGPGREGSADLGDSLPANDPTNPTLQLQESFRGSLLSGMTLLSLLVLMLAAILPLPGATGIEGPMTHWLRLEGVSFHALVGFFLVLFASLVPLELRLRAPYLVVVSFGIFLLGVLDLRAGVLVLAFHGHPIARFLMHGAGLGMVVCMLALIPTGLFQLSQGNRQSGVSLLAGGSLLLGVSLFGLQVLSPLVVEAPLVSLWKAGFMGDVLGDQLASILVMMTLGMALVLGGMALVFNRRSYGALGGIVFTLGGAVAAVIAVLFLSRDLGAILEPLKIVLLLASAGLLFPASLSAFISSVLPVKRA